MYLEIISPGAILYKGEVKSISFPGSYGDFQVLDNHAPIVSTLKKGKVIIQGKLTIDKEAFASQILARAPDLGPTL